MGQIPYQRLLELKSIVNIFVKHNRKFSEILFSLILFHIYHLTIFFYLSLKYILFYFQKILNFIDFKIIVEIFKILILNQYY